MDPRCCGCVGEYCCNCGQGDGTCSEEAWIKAEAERGER